MANVKIAAVSLNQTPLDFDGNRQRIISAINRAKKEEISLLCFNELTVSGYGCEDMFFSEGVYKKSFSSLELIKEHTENIACAVGCPVRLDGNNYNSVFLIANKKIVGGYAKHVLADDGVYYEQRWFEPWELGKKVTIKNDIPFGNYVFNLGGLKFGFEICEDAWTDFRPADYYNNIDLILNPSASHFAFGKFEVRKKIVSDSSKKYSCGYLYANANGNESGRLIFDAGSLFAKNGKLEMVGKRFSYDDVLISSVGGEFGEKGEFNSEYFDSINVDFTFKELGQDEDQDFNEESWETDKEIKCQEFTRAVSLGLHDYLRKSRAKGYVVSLSGGADSSAVASLCAISFALSGYSGSVKDKLLCAYLASDNSGEVTENASRELAKELGAEFHNFKISDLVQLYSSKVNKSLDVDLNWKEHDIVLQNIQCRTRSPLVWMLANFKNFLLLATSNRSEAAVGYTTMDGDTSGGLSPIGGIDKEFLRYWLKWLEKGGLEEVGPIKSLSLVNKQEPTAELRPKEMSQTDEKDLMPYEVLEQIEDLAIGQKLLEDEVFIEIKKVREESDDTLKNWVSKFFKLWKANQWKRERYAPSFHLDDKSLDPKTWCRYPILSG